MDSRKSSSPKRRQRAPTSYEGSGFVAWASASALMASHAENEYVIPKLTEDDLAGLYFLYPSRRRSDEWGTKPIKVSEMRVAKLKHLAAGRKAKVVPRLPQRAVPDVQDRPE